MSNIVKPYKNFDTSVELVEQSRNYQRIAQAIEYIKKHYHSQPSLSEIAASVNMSDDHFQRTFRQWAGVSPKKFIQYLSLEQAKAMLQKNQVSLLQASESIGLSGTGRLHDLFVNIESMTPGEYKQAADKLIINYCFAATYFGEVIIASTQKGVCHIAFIKDRKQALADLRNNYSKASFEQCLSVHQQQAIEFLNSISNSSQFPAQERSAGAKTLKLHLKASPFQLKVWQALLDIPFAELDTYGQVAARIAKAGAARAVGSAIAKNPIAFIIPCHRVIQSSGKTGEYMWGATRKSAMIAWEASAHDK